MANIGIEVYEAMLAALKADTLQDQIVRLSDANERRALLIQTLTDELRAYGLQLEDLFDPYDLSLLDTPLDLTTLQVRLNLQIQLQVLKRPSLPLPAMDDAEAKRKAYSGKSDD